MVGTKLSKSCCKSPRKVCSVAFPSLYLLSKLSIYCSNVIYSFNFCQSVGKKWLFWFFCVGFACWQKPNVLFVRWLFQHGIQRFGAWRSGGFRSTKLLIHHKS